MTPIKNDTTGIRQARRHNLARVSRVGLPRGGDHHQSGRVVKAAYPVAVGASEPAGEDVPAAVGFDSLDAHVDRKLGRLQIRAGRCRNVVTRNTGAAMYVQKQGVKNVSARFRVAVGADGAANGVFMPLGMHFGTFGNKQKPGFFGDRFKGVDSDAEMIVFADRNQLDRAVMIAIDKVSVDANGEGIIPDDVWNVLVPEILPACP